MPKYDGLTQWHSCHLVLPQVSNLLKEEIPQIYALCGRGSRSSLKILRPGLGVTELAVAPLPGQSICVSPVS